MKILLIRLDHLGDLVLTTPLIRALAKATHEIDVLTLRWLVPVLENNSHVHEAIAIEDIAPGFPDHGGALRRWMKARRYDCILLPNPEPRQLLWCSLGSGAQRRIALQAGWMGRITGHECLQVRKSFMRGRHFSDLMLDLARRLDVPTDGLKPDYFCRPEELDQARAKISTLFPDYQGEPILGIHPGCQSNTCNLPPRAYGEFASLALARTNWRIIVTGSAKELALLQSWPSEILASPRVYVSMGELDLRSLAAMISLMQNYVIGSTGPLHLAAALGVPTTSPFCPLPPISASVWGNASANGTCVQPNPECCRRWTASAPPHRHCDLRGEITAEHLWTSLEQRKSIQL